MADNFVSNKHRHAEIAKLIQLQNCNELRNRYKPLKFKVTAEMKEKFSEFFNRQKLSRSFLDKTPIISNDSPFHVRIKVNDTNYIKRNIKTSEGSRSSRNTHYITKTGTAIQPIVFPSNVDPYEQLVSQEKTKTSIWFMQKSHRNSSLFRGSNQSVIQRPTLKRPESRQKTYSKLSEKIDEILKQGIVSKQPTNVKSSVLRSNSQRPRIVINTENSPSSPELNISRGRIRPKKPLFKAVNKHRRILQNNREDLVKSYENVNAISVGPNNFLYQSDDKSRIIKGNHLTAEYRKTLYKRRIRQLILHNESLACKQVSLSKRDNKHTENNLVC